MNYGDLPLDETLHMVFTTRAFATGIPGTLSAATVEVYEDGTATPIISSIAVTENFSAVTGLNMVPIVATSGNGYNVGASYHVVIQVGTVDSVSVVGEVIGSFTIGRSAALAQIGTAGAGLTAINLPNQTMDITGNITGNLSGSVGSVSGNVDGSVASVTAGVSLGADAIGAANIADNAIAVEHIANGAITAAKITAMDATAWSNSQNFFDATGYAGGTIKLTTDETTLDGLITTVGTAGDGLTNITLNAASINLFWDELMTETAGAPSVTASFRDAFRWMFALSRNRILQTATLTTLRNDANSGDLDTSTVSDDASTYVRGEWGV